MNRYICTVCRYVHEGEPLPSKCPVCDAPSTVFELIVPEDSMCKTKVCRNKNSNTYIIIYSTIMVVLVATILSLTSLSLKDRQKANELNEKKSAIVGAIGLPAGSYDENITAYVVDEDGNTITTTQTPIEMLFSLVKAFEVGEYPIFENVASGEVVIPVIGKGLWGDVWGYVALKSDLNTIKGVVFDHKSETPGLGAELSTPKFWAQFPNLTIYDGDELVAIEFVKGGAKGAPHAVDAITGGTKTSIGLENMLKVSLSHYDNFFKSKRLNSENNE